MPTVYKHASTNTRCYASAQSAETNSNITIIKACKLIQASMKNVQSLSCPRWPPKRLAVACFQILALLLPGNAA